MTGKAAVRTLFVIAALYDGLIGLAFLIAPSAILSWVEAVPPNHMGYVQFPAALLMVFAIMFAKIARDPGANRDLIPYGIMLKLSYCAVVFWYWIAGTITGIWKPFAVADLVFLLLFVLAYRSLQKGGGLAQPG